MRKRKGIKFLVDLVFVVFIALTAMFMAVVLLEYLAGCGVMYTDSEGNRHIGECLWLNVDKGE